MGEAGKRLEEVRLFVTNMESMLNNMEPVVRAADDPMLFTAIESLKKDVEPFQEYIARHDRRILVRNLLQDCLYVFIDAGDEDRNCVQMAGRVVSGGAKAVQLRFAGSDKRSFADRVREITEICHQGGALCFVKSEIDIAITGGADGVHLAQKDLAVTDVRKIVPRSMLIGASVYNMPQAKQAVEHGADYLLAGPVYVSRNTIEPKLEGIGTRLLVELLHGISVPVVAYGGIYRDNVYEVLSTGIRSLGMFSAIMLDEDPYEQSLYFSSVIRREHETQNR